MRCLIAGGVFLMAVTASVQSSSDFRFPADSEIRRIISERIENRKQRVGIVVGLVGPEGRRIVARGHSGKDSPRFVDANTVFEIGSVTKIFTAMLLADMTQRSEAELADPIAKHLPEEMVVPQRGGKEITLADLATHTSGLPRIPDNFSPAADPVNIYADYSIEQLYQFLSNHQLTRDIGAQWAYSNLGYALLAQALTWRAGADYETLVRNRIFTPLGMKSTAIILSPEMKARLAAGHNLASEAVPNWDLTTFAGAGGLRSTANDLLTFLEMALGIKQTPLAPALDATLAVRRPTGMHSEWGLGWGIMKSGEDEMIWHNGVTGGYTSFIGFLMKEKVGVVVLSNTSAAGVENVGYHLLNPEIPLSPPPKQHIAMAIDPCLYDGYVGRYHWQEDFILTVTREGDHLFVQATGYEKVEFFPEGERDFFSKGVDAQITFEVDDGGRAESLVLHLDGQRMPASRISE
ncbi:serine hydrolase [Nitrosospira multiformis]|nr:serine hydrolase [Nitrosospira multiformis]